jgi:hypothetical protein
MPGDFRCDRGDYARVLFSFAREAAGASRARHSLRPLIFRRRDLFKQTSRETRGEIAKLRLEGMPLFEKLNPYQFGHGLVVRDARRCRAPHHEGPRPHPEERTLVRVSKDEATASETILTASAPRGRPVCPFANRSALRSPSRAASSLPESARSSGCERDRAIPGFLAGFRHSCPGW